MSSIPVLVHIVLRLRSSSGMPSVAPWVQPAVRRTVRQGEYETVSPKVPGYPIVELFPAFYVGGERGLLRPPAAFAERQAFCLDPCAWVVHHKNSRIHCSHDGCSCDILALHHHSAFCADG